MIIKPIVTDNHPNAILFFNGWGMNELVVAHMIPPQGYDLFVVYDYRHLEVFPQQLFDYDSITLIAWSIGVWAAEHLARKDFLPPIRYGIALAGSPFIRHDHFGIPHAIFDLTLEKLTDETRIQFNRRMCGGKSLRPIFEAFSSRSTEELRAELSKVQRLERQPNDFSLALSWDRLIIASKDKIIPSHNLENLAITYNIPYNLLPEAQHFIFSDITSWQELLNLLLPC